MPALLATTAFVVVNDCLGPRHAYLSRSLFVEALCYNNVYHRFRRREALTLAFILGKSCHGSFSRSPHALARHEISIAFPIVPHARFVLQPKLAAFSRSLDFFG